MTQQKDHVTLVLETHRHPLLLLPEHPYHTDHRCRLHREYLLPLARHIIETHITGNNGNRHPVTCPSNSFDTLSEIIIYRRIRRISEIESVRNRQRSATRTYYIPCRLCHSNHGSLPGLHLYISRIPVHTYRQ